MMGRNGMDSPKEMQRPSSQVTVSPAAARARRHSSTSRDLPMPASPVMNTTWPRPALASLKRSRSSPNSRSRPTRGEAALDSHVKAHAAAARAQHLKGAYRGTSLDRHLTQVEGLEEATDRPVRRLTHQHAARAGHLLQARRQVGGISHGGVVHAQVIADLANDYQASVEPQAHLQGQAALRLQLLTVCP